MIVALTGHRPDKLGGYGPSLLQDKVRLVIRDELSRLRPTRVISGMALGVDQWGAEEAVALGIPVHAAVPFRGQEVSWPTEAQKRYRALISACEHVHVVSSGGYRAGAMLVRDMWMVDNCDLLLAVWDGTKGGTAHTYLYAKSIKREIIRIDPSKLT